MTVENNEAVNETVEQTEEVKTFTQEEVDKLLQAETDRKTTKALETAKAKWEQEFEAKLQAEKSEAEKLAKMSEEERHKAELAKEREKFEEERKAFHRERLEAQTVKELSQSGLPVQFASYLMADDADSIKGNIDTFKTHWQKAIEDAVNERLKGSTPKSANVAGKTMTRQEFAKLNYHERVKLMEDNPDVVKQFLNK
ncbi:DUF4355 domain-containing protein [Sporosarcina saromensis]|uniref:DUF4355 domain-containing protein n=1 Tax=Sporosarcina saromensis TaxID=359365 RepID=A0ABU4G773_9BACL|nr:DUF4355 domain-containing protein [Sporosarcina saromensis]MDW0112163.1 DUF4355 domain-containing protein [Sporosarcina saromensis]